MPLKQHHIEELRTIYYKEFGHELTNDAAWAMAHRLINLYRMLIRREHERRQKAQTL